MKILVAESQKTIRRLMVNSLEEANHEVLKASDSSGLDILLGEKGDLLILDASLVGNQLAQYLGHIKNRHPLLRVILTVFPGESDQYNIVAEKNVFSKLIKPFTEEDFMALLKTLEKGQESEEKDDANRFIDVESLPSAKIHPLMQKAVGFLKNVADSDITVLITGESGVGKEAFAKRLHQLSRRRDNRFVGINCASIPASLLESELFGSEKGAYTGSMAKQIGKFELSNKGSLLLDEISEMDMALQSKLLRVIQEKEFYRIGGSEKVKLDIRIIATTNRDLREWIKMKNFREDLYYRLNVISIKIPPLRERLDDIPLLANQILQKIGRERSDKRMSLAPAALEQLKKYPWPGNIRELENILIRTVYMTPGNEIQQIFFDEWEMGEISKPTIANQMNASNVPSGTIRDVERQMICRVLEMNNGNRVRAANVLGISVRTLRNKLKLYREEGVVELAQFDDPMDQEDLDGEGNDTVSSEEARVSNTNSN